MNERNVVRLRTGRSVSAALARRAAALLLMWALVGCVATGPEPFSEPYNVPHSKEAATVQGDSTPVLSVENSPLGAKVVAFARANLGRLVGGGECAELADAALTMSGARTFRDFAAKTQGQDYVWGTPISLAAARPGDIVQFRGFQVETVTQSRAGESESEYDLEHHTAIVEANLGGSLLVLEQNGEPERNVRRTRLPVKTGTYAGDENGAREADAVTSVRVSGAIKVYRAQPAEAF